MRYVNSNEVNLKRYFFTIIFFIVFSNTKLFSQNLIFYKERIEIHIKKNGCFLKGRYYFKNTSELSVDKTIYYPISKKHNLSKPDSLAVFDLTKGKIITYSKYLDGISFNLQVPKNEQVVFEVTYFQKAPKQKMEYILTTTKKWHRPLEQAEFIIKINSGLILKFLSMKYDYKKITVNDISYLISRFSFMPNSNLLIQWR